MGDKGKRDKGKTKIEKRKEEINAQCCSVTLN